MIKTFKLIGGSVDLDEKCAPNRKFTDGSCFNEKELKTIAKSYNERTKDNINVNVSKKELVKTLEDKLKSKCSEQTCWLRLDFVKAIENKNEELMQEMNQYTFRPVGPKGKYEWLSTNHINEVVDQYHKLHKDFEFLGAVPVDFQDLSVLQIGNMNFDEKVKEGKTKLGMVINLDEHWQSGSHWVALYTDLLKNKVYYFDSVGKTPPARVKRFVNKLLRNMYQRKYNKDISIKRFTKRAKYLTKLSEKERDLIIKQDEELNNMYNGGFDIRHNNVQHQFDNSECGVYSINFIIRLVSGESFDSVTQNITKDEKMNKNRQEYFRNVDFSK